MPSLNCCIVYCKQFGMLFYSQSEPEIGPSIDQCSIPVSKSKINILAHIDRRKACVTPPGEITYLKLLPYPQYQHGYIYSGMDESLK